MPHEMQVKVACEPKLAWEGIPAGNDMVNMDK